MTTHERRLAVLTLVLGFSILSTGLHFTHNFVEVGQYPDENFSHTAIRVAIVIAWPLGTAIALWGYRLYGRRQYVPAHRLLAFYSLLGFSTLGHFTESTPDIAPFWMATIVTDAVGGLGVLTFVVLSLRATRAAAAGDRVP